MEVSESIHSFNISTNFITSGLPKTLKSIDDILGQGKNPQEIYNPNAAYQDNQKQIRTEKKFFCIGTQIDFGINIIKEKRN